MGLCLQCCPHGAVPLGLYPWVCAPGTVSLGLGHQGCPHGALTLGQSPWGWATRAVPMQLSLWVCATTDVSMGLSHEAMSLGLSLWGCAPGLPCGCPSGVVPLVLSSQGCSTGLCH